MLVSNFNFPSNFILLFGNVRKLYPIPITSMTDTLGQTGDVGNNPTSLEHQTYTTADLEVKISIKIYPL